VEHEPRAQLPIKASSEKETPDTLEESFFKLSGQLSTICIPFKVDADNSTYAKVFPNEGKS
jgi:hypothetical protein